MNRRELIGRAGVAAGAFLVPAAGGWRPGRLWAAPEPPTERTVTEWVHLYQGSALNPNLAAERPLYVRGPEPQYEQRYDRMLLKAWHWRGPDLLLAMDWELPATPGRYEPLLIRIPRVTPQLGDRNLKLINTTHPNWNDFYRRPLPELQALTHVMLKEFLT